MSAVTGASGRTAATAACLRIHAGPSARRRRLADVKALWHRWIDRAPATATSSDAAHLRVEVAAEPGHPLFALSDPQGTVEMTVGPGTYDITVVAGRRKRQYTVTLDPGITVDLDLHDAMQAD